MAGATPAKEYSCLPNELQAPSTVSSEAVFPAKRKDELATGYGR
jgi:hypothetical protein